MPEQLGPLEIECDAPDYAIIKACSRLGLRSPEDVRWCHLSRGHTARSAWHEILLGLIRPAQGSCVCGGSFPELQGYLFTFNTGSEITCVLGQCDRCRTIFWDSR
jgi:hypothetical protein